MHNLDEQYENLYEFIKNFEILIQKNVFDNEHLEEISIFGKEILNLCKSKEFNITSNDILSLNSFGELFIRANGSSKGYLASQVDNFLYSDYRTNKGRTYFSLT